MKKTLISFCIILVGLFVVLSLLDARGNYAAEQRIYHTNQRLVKIRQTPEAVPDATYEEVASSYRKIIENFPNSPIAPHAHILLGKVYSIKKDYPKARQIFDEICPKYQNNNVICTQASLSKGETYELGGDWPKALEVYNKIVRDYPVTDVGLRTPLYIAKYYEKNKQIRQARNAYALAIGHYNKLLPDYSDSTIEFKLLSLLANSYISTRNWESALDVLKTTLLKYPHLKTAMPMTRNINAIALTQLQDADSAINLYQSILDQKPEHPLRKFIAEMIKSLNVVKESNAKITLQE